MYSKSVFLVEKKSQTGVIIHVGMNLHQTEVSKNFLLYLGEEKFFRNIQKLSNLLGHNYTIITFGNLQ